LLSAFVADALWDFCSCRTLRNNNRVMFRVVMQISKPHTDKAINWGTAAHKITGNDVRRARKQQEQLKQAALTHEQLLEIAGVVAEHEETPPHLPVLVESDVVRGDGRTDTRNAHHDDTDYVWDVRIFEPVRLVAQHDADENVDRL